MKKNKISVCLASYNGASFIQEQLESILIQLPNKYDEVIISDDGSTDMTLEIIKSINDKRIKIISGPGNGVIKNFEHCLKYASGDIIFLSDQDDIWVSNKVEIYLNELINFYTVFSNVSIIDSNGNIVKNHLYSEKHNKSGLIKNLVKNSAIGATIAFRKDVLKKALPFPNNIEMHDTWIGLISEVFYNVKYLNEPYLKYRRHGNNASSASEKSTNSLSEKILIRLRYIWSIFLRVSNIS